MSKNNNRTKMMVSTNLLEAMLKLYPDAPSANNALQQHLVLTLPEKDQSVSYGRNENELTELQQTEI
jgi:hypothetical protein